jgi:hypothetical protein
MRAFLVMTMHCYAITGSVEQLEAVVAVVVSAVQ